MTRRVVVFDLGMVLSSPDRLYSSVAEILGTTPEAAERGFWGPHRHAYDEGSSDLDFWTTAVPLTGAEGVDLDAVLPQLVHVDIRGWRSPRPGSRAILARLKEAGVETAILSNAPESFANESPNFDWYDQIDTWFFSGLLKVAKPDPEIYRQVEEGLGLPGSQLWFVDDKQENIDTALSRGWNAHLWQDDADTEAWLTREGFLA